MAITEKSYSWYGPTIAVCPVYNPITFVLDSTRKTRDNFNYIVDVYYSGTSFPNSGEHFATRIDSYPNLLNYYGQFDIHKVLENFVSYDLNWDVDRVTLAPNSMKRFIVYYGERFSSENTFSTVNSRASGAYTGYLQINTPAPHALSVNDRVLIDKDDKTTDPSYDGVKTVVEIVDADSIVVNMLYGTGSTSQSGTLIEGTQFYDTNFYNGNVALLCSNAHNMHVGDTIIVRKDNTSINPQYDGEWTVTSISSSTIVVTNIPWGSNTTLEGGMVYVKGNKLLTGLTSSANYAWALNSADDYNQRMSFAAQRDYADLYALDGTMKKFLTNSPTTQKIQVGDYHSLSFLYGQHLLTTFSAIKLKIYFTNGTDQTDYWQMGSYYNTAQPYQTRFDIGVGPANIDSAYTNSVFLITPAPNWDLVDYYEISAYDSGTTANTSMVYTFEIDRECSKYDTYRFMWLNRVGGFDYFNFKKRSDEIKEIERSSYESKLGKYNGDLYGWDIGDRGNVVHNVKITEKASVFSDWISEEQSEWLANLFYSPEVYLIRNNQIYPIVVSNEQYIFGKRENQKLFNVQCEFQYAYPKISQRG